MPPHNILLSNVASFAALYANKGFASYIRQHFLDRTFQGLYRANAFDIALLVPYFVVLILLASYGLHRYILVYLYYKNRKNHTSEPATRFEDLPRVTVQLPMFNEQFVAERLIESVCKLKYPREKLDIQVLDDSTDETVEVVRNLVERYAALGHPITYHHRTNREGFKAGALAEGMKSATGEFIAIFDADFSPPPGILHQMVHYFTDAKVAVVQGRWTWINRHYSNLSEIEAILLDGHFVIEHGGRNFSGRFFNFNGTAGMWRRVANEEAGGWQHDTLTEDTDLSYRAQLKGWKFVYAPDIICPSELPVEMNSFKTQQARWAKGLIQVAKKILPQVWRSPESLKIKMEATLHLTANIAYPLMIVFSVILLPAMIVRFYQGWFQMLYLDLPLFLASTCSVSTFYMVAQRELYPKSWTSRIKYVPFVMATGIGLSLKNAKVVIEALLGRKSEFVRTPKYRVEGNEGGWESKKYLGRAGWISAAELSLAAYFLCNVIYSFTIENYLTTPFLVLFLMGYAYIGTMSLLQTPMRRLWTSLPGLARVRDRAVSTAA